MKFYTKKRRSPTIAIVSLIDILAILLIFFILTTTFKKQEPQVQINLPKSTTAAKVPAETEPAVLQIAADSTITLDGENLSVDQLAVAVKSIVENTPKRPFAMRADEKVPFGLIIEVMDVMKDNGVTNLPAFTQKKEK